MTDLPVPTSDGGSVTATDALAALTQIVSAAGEYSRIRQVERTKREAVASAERKEVDRIRAAERDLRSYFEMVFAERAKMSADLFARLDRAMESGDPQMVNAVVVGLVEVAKVSPLAQLADFGAYWKELGTGDDPIVI